MEIFTEATLINFFILQPIGLVIYFAIRPLFRRDYTILKTNSAKVLVNVLNWSAPNWGKRFTPYYKHFGPILIVSNELVMRNCSKRCHCQWMEIKGQESHRAH